MIKINHNDLKLGLIEQPEIILTSKTDLPVIPKPQKDVETIQRKPRPRLKESRADFL